MKELGIEASYNSLIYLARRDCLRNLSRTLRINETHKSRRRQIVAHKKLAESSRKRRDKAIYSSSKFGSEVTSSGDESELCAPNVSSGNPRFVAGESTSPGSVAIFVNIGTTIAVKVSRIQDNYQSITSVVNVGLEIIVRVC